ncbi:MAG: aminoacyl-tRNA hydrolase [Bacilli bacterium]
MKLFVGLGNKGNEYNGTRHNIGFMVIDKFAQQENTRFDKTKFGGLYCEIIKNNEKVILLKPQEYINLSGNVIKKYMDYFKIDLNDLFVISDDLDLSIGKYKIKSKGGAGGHNGLKNIELNLKTKEYKRIKIGISNNKLIDTKDYVLGKLNGDELTTLNEVINEAIRVLNDYFYLSIDNLMNKYNK